MPRKIEISSEPVEGFTNLQYTIVNGKRLSSALSPEQRRALEEFGIPEIEFYTESELGRDVRTRLRSPRGHWRGKIDNWNDSREYSYFTISDDADVDKIERILRDAEDEECYKQAMKRRG